MAIISGSIGFGGLASNLDTNAIIEKLVSLASTPLTKLQDQQSATHTRISLLADLSSRLDSLKAAASKLGSSGVMALQTTLSNESFSARPGAGARAGSFSVKVESVATVAKWRSAAFGANDTLSAGTLQITVDDQPYPPSGGIAVDDTTTLESLAAAIRATGAPVAVNVLDNGTSRYLSITNLQTGYTTSPESSLKVEFDDLAEPFFAAPTLDEHAANAVFDVDSLQFTRPTNTVSDAIPGTTLTLKAGGGPSAPDEILSIGYDASGTQANLQRFVDAYNSLMSAIQAQLAVNASTNRATTLAGDANVRTLASTLQALTTASAYSSGAVRCLSDLGVKTSADGSLSVDATALASAVSRDPAAVDAIFAQATTGIVTRVFDIATSYGSVTGLLAREQTSLEKQISDMDEQAAKIQSRIDAYRAQLIAQYAAMENAVSRFKSIGDFLTAQDNANNKK